MVLFLSMLTCFVLDIGEVYQYSRWYKRSFGFFGDGFPFVCILFLIIHLQLKSPVYGSMAMAMLVLSGGRVSIIAAIVSALALSVYQRQRAVIFLFARCLVWALVVYAAAIYSSNEFVSYAMKVLANNVAANIVGENPYAGANDTFVVRGFGKTACDDLGKCYRTQVESPIKQRLVSSLAGAWMTLQGGFAGKRYPGTADKFADFMISENPWHINDRFDMSWHDWHKVGAVQNPYLNFGSGYGPVGLIALGVGFLMLVIIGFQNLKEGRDTTPWSSLTIYFAIVVAINQTQPWIQGKSLLLFLVGVCGAHILATRLLSSSERS